MVYCKKPVPVPAARFPVRLRPEVIFHRIMAGVCLIVSLSSCLKLLLNKKGVPPGEAGIGGPGAFLYATRDLRGIVVTAISVQYRSACDFIAYEVRQALMRSSASTITLQQEKQRDSECWFAWPHRTMVVAMGVDIILLGDSIKLYKWATFYCKLHQQHSRTPLTEYSTQIKKISTMRFSFISGLVFGLFVTRRG